jgi:hypothetical protein
MTCASVFVRKDTQNRSKKFYHRRGWRLPNRYGVGSTFTGIIAPSCGRKPSFTTTFARFNNQPYWMRMSSFTLLALNESGSLDRYNSPQGQSRLKLSRATYALLCISRGSGASFATFGVESLLLADDHPRRIMWDVRSESNMSVDESENCAADAAARLCNPTLRAIPTTPRGRGSSPRGSNGALLRKSLPTPPTRLFFKLNPVVCEANRYDQRILVYPNH